MANEMSDFTNWINEELNKREWSQAELARRAGFSRSAISDVMKHKYQAGTEFCTKVAKAFGYSPEQVYRQAGLLPPLANEDPRIEEWEHIFNETPENERQTLIDYARFQLEQLKKRKE